MTCSSDNDICVKAFVDGNVGNISTKAFATSCTVISFCAQDHCKTVSQAGNTVNKCEVDCCVNDLCNEPKVPATDECGLYALGMRSSSYFSL